MQAINPINTHTKFGKDRINTIPSNERKPSETADDGKSKNNMSTPQWGGHNNQEPPCIVKNRVVYEISAQHRTLIKFSMYLDT